MTLDELLSAVWEWTGEEAVDKEALEGVLFAMTHDQAVYNAIIAEVAKRLGELREAMSDER